MSIDPILGRPSGSPYQSMLRRAEALRPMLLAHAPEADRTRRLTEPVVEAVRASGVVRMVRPPRFGGAGLWPTILLDVDAALAEGCPSTAWVVGNLAIHELMLAAWPQQAQEEIWSANPDAFIASSLLFHAGKGRKVAGGWRIGGRWSFSSGSNHADWLMLGAMTDPGDGRAEEQRFFMVPRADVELIDTWTVMGLRGTGSGDVAASDLFVPEHRALAYPLLARAEGPGRTINTEPLYRFPFSAGGTYILVGVMCGAVRGAIARFTEGVGARVSRANAKSFAQDPLLQANLAEAAATLDAAEALAHLRINAAMERAVASEPTTGRHVVELRRDSAFCTRLCVRAVDLVFNSAGAAALFEQDPVQRAWRDVHAGAAHFAIRWETFGAAYGRVMFGLPSGLPGLDV